MTDTLADELGRVLDGAAERAPGAGPDFLDGVLSRRATRLRRRRAGATGTVALTVLAIVCVAVVGGPRFRRSPAEFRTGRPTCLRRAVRPGPSRPR